jgi:hypothetical protein
MTVHSVSCIVALSKAAVIEYPTVYRHTCIHTPVYRHTCILYEEEKDLKIKVVKFDNKF